MNSINSFNYHRIIKAAFEFLDIEKNNYLDE